MDLDTNEAKLSCIATAIYLNITYVHHPFTSHMEHVDNGGEMEDFFQLSGNRFNIFDKGKDVEKTRDCARGELMVEDG